MQENLHFCAIVENWVSFLNTSALFLYEKSVKSQLTSEFEIDALLRVSCDLDVSAKNVFDACSWGNLRGDTSVQTASGLAITSLSFSFCVGGLTALNITVLDLDEDNGICLSFGTSSSERAGSEALECNGLNSKLDLGIKVLES